MSKSRIMTFRGRAITESDRIRELENAIRKHRDQEGDDRCFEDDYELYNVLEEGFDKIKLRLNDPCTMMAHCVKYIQSRHNPDLPYMSPQREIEKLKKRVEELVLLLENKTDRAVFLEMLKKRGYEHVDQEYRATDVRIYAGVGGSKDAWLSFYWKEDGSFDDIHWSD